MPIFRPQRAQTDKAIRHIAKGIIDWQRVILRAVSEIRGVSNMTQLEGEIRERFGVVELADWLKAYMRAQYERIGQREALAVARWVKKNGKRRDKADFMTRNKWEPPADVQEFSVRLGAILAAVAAEREHLMVGIATDIQDQIIETIRAMYSEGKSILDIQKEIAKIIPSPTKIDKLFGIMGRAERIARTEAAFAANTATHQSIVKMGIKGYKIWSAEPDPTRTRESHLAMNGVRVEIDKPFVSAMTGDEVMYPCDSTMGASAAFVINCRCVAKYDLEI